MNGASEKMNLVDNKEPSLPCLTQEKTNINVKQINQPGQKNLGMIGAVRLRKRGRASEKAKTYSIDHNN